MEMVDNEICIRLLRPEDHPRMVELAGNINVARNLRDCFPHPYTKADAEAWQAALAKETRPCNFVMAWKGEFVGGIGLEPLTDVHSGTADIGYWLGEPYWGKGIVTRAVRLVTEYAFDELLFIRLQAMIHADNPGSMRVLEKNGYMREGVLRKHVRKFGVVKDCVLYARLRNPD